MAALSRKVEDSINKFFQIYMLQDECISNDDIFYRGTMNKFLVIDNSAEKEVPTCCFNQTIDKIISRENPFIYIPLHDHLSNRKAYKTAHMIFNNLVSRPGRRGVLARIRTSNNEIYYGSHGIILDSEKNPLLLSTVNVKKSSETYIISNLTLYINPSVFTKDGVLEKFIKDKIVPFLLSRGVSFDSGIRNSSVRDRITRKVDENLFSKAFPNIVISESINNFFSAPEEYDVDGVSTCILACIDDFMEFIGV